ncbi:hypothetical protein ACLESO_06315 [Pyxidicoccus sp. 3LG]
MDGSACGILAVLFLVILRFLEWQSGKERLVEAALGWSDFARRHELRGDGLSVRGVYKGYVLLLDTERRHMGKSRVTLSHVVLAVPTLPREVVLKPGGFFAAGPVRQVSTTPEMKAMLEHMPLRMRFSEAAEAYHELVVESGYISAKAVGVPRTLEELEVLIEPALQLARAFDEAARLGALNQSAGPEVAGRPGGKTGR